MSITAKRIRPPLTARVVRLPVPTAELATRLVANKSLRAGDVKAFLTIEPRQAAGGPPVRSASPRVRAASWGASVTTRRKDAYTF